MILFKNRINKIRKLLNFDNFWRENSNYHRTQRIINQNNSFIFGTKIQIDNILIFLKIEFLDTI